MPGRILTIISGLALSVMGLAGALTPVSRHPDPKPPPPAAQRAELGTPFVENVGQWRDREVRFAAPLPGGRLLVTARGDLVHLLGRTWFAERLSGRALAPSGTIASAARVTHLDGTSGRSLPAFSEVSLGEVAPGIELVLRASSGNVEKIFRVGPGSDPGALEIQVDEARLSVGADGHLQLETAAGPVRFTRPVAYQEGPAGRTGVAVAYRTDGAHYGFAVGPYDRARELVIDPTLESARVGGTDLDVVDAVAVSSQGIYAVGSTLSPDLPAGPGALDMDLSGTADAFIAHLDRDLSLLELTYLGGSGNETGLHTAVRSDQRVVITGSTSSVDFPVVGGVQADFGGVQDSFIAVLEPDLSALVASTYLGGSAWPDEVDGMALAVDDSVYVVGFTASPDWPTTCGAHDVTRAGIQDGFVTHLSSDLSSISASTLLGGSSAEVVRAIALAADGDVVVGGDTQSTDFPVSPGALEPTWDGGSIEEGFVTRLDGGLQTIVASTFLGGDSDAQIRSLAIDGTGRIAAAGDAYTDSFPVTPGAYDVVFDGLAEAFVTLLDPHLGAVSASTFLGGDGALDYGEGITLGADGVVYLVGRTYSSAFPVSGDAVDTTGQGSEVYVATLDRKLEHLLHATYLGGAQDDFTWGPAVLDADGRIVIGGGTESDDFPGLVPGSGGEDGFVAVIDGLPAAICGLRQ